MSEVTTPSRRVDGRTARRVETRRRLEEAGLSLFAAHGYEATTIDDVAAAAGMSKGAVFYNYRDKADLFSQLFQSSITALAGAMRHGIEGRRGWDAFAAATRELIEFIDANPAPAVIVVNELFRAGRAWDDTRAGAREILVEPLVDAMAQVGEERTAHGLPAQVSPDDLPNLAMAVFGGLLTAALDRRAFDPARSVDEIHGAQMQALSGLAPWTRSTSTGEEPL